MSKIIDLFAGAGGLSLGAARAGFDIVAAVENDPHALATHKLNFPNCGHFSNDIRKLKGKEILKDLNLKPSELTGLVGGPPCQGFSTMGWRRTGDRRNVLFVHFFRLVNEILPSFFLAENVPGIMRDQYADLRKRAFKKLSKRYVVLSPIRVKASDYGVPTTRTRVFFIGFDPSKFSLPLTETDFLPPKDAETILVDDALAGLPESVSPDWQSEEEGWRLVVKKHDSFYMSYITENIPNGVGHEASVNRYRTFSEVSGCQGTRHVSDVVKRFRNLQQGKQDKVSKAIKLNPKGFCPTLRAGTGSDRGSYQAIRPIHYNEPRVITPREAARLQGFPDWFVFHPTKWHSFRQIGNSVSPIVAEYLLKKILSAI